MDNIISFKGTIIGNRVKWKQVTKKPKEYDLFVSIPRVIYYTQKERDHKNKFIFVRRYEHFNLYKQEECGYNICFDDFDLHLMMTNSYRNEWEEVE